MLSAISESFAFAAFERIAISLREQYLIRLWRIWGVLVLGFALQGFAQPGFAQPMINSVTAPVAGSYDNTDDLEFVVSFSEDIQVTPTDEGEFGFLVLALDSGNAYAAYQSHNSSSITFSYTPSNQDFDFNGINLLGFQGLQVTNAAGFFANLNLGGVDELPKIEIVHGNTASLPTLDNYQSGDELVYTLRWGRVTQIEMSEGIPQLSILVGNNQYTLNGEATSQGEIVFRHVVTESDMDVDGIITGELDLNDTIIMGTLDGRNDTSFGRHELTVTNRTFINNGLVSVTQLGETPSEVLVAGASIPRIESISVPGSGDYLIGDTLSFTVQFNQQVLSTDTGSTVLRISLGQGREVEASYVSDSAAQNTWQFDYVVTSADKAANGIRLLALNSGGQYYDEGPMYAFSNWRDLVLNNVANSSGISVNVANTAQIVSVNVPDLTTYVTGDTLSITLNYSQSVFVEGTPLLYLTIGDTQVIAQYVSGSGTSSLTFSYVLAPGLEGANEISIDKIVLDGASVLSVAGVSADVQLINLDDQPPVIAQPQDLDINATGLLTSISELVPPTAYDEQDGDVEVHLDSPDSSYLMPGLHELVWYAVDAAGNRSEVRQSLAIHPLISLSNDQIQAEGAESRVQVILNGEPPEYPFTVFFDVSGSATGPNGEGQDHNLSSGSIVFVESDFVESEFVESDDEQSDDEQSNVLQNGSETNMFSKDITFSILEDNQIEGNETIEVTLTGSGNFGNKTRHITTISESNVAPNVTLQVSQNESNVLIIDQASGLVDLIAEVSDSNSNDLHTVAWDFSDDVSPIVVSELQRQIEPSNLLPGTYSVTVSVSDNGSPSLSKQVSLTYRIVDELATLTSQDSDGDGVSDVEEGWADDDLDGQPNYLDPIAMDNVISETSDDGLAFLIESDPGLKLTLGERALANGGQGAQLNIELLPEELQMPADSISNVSGYFDFVINGLSESGQSVNVVLPQRAVIPADAVYRKFDDGVWFDFVEDASNGVMSAPGSEGSCPSPQSSEYQTGLNQGDWCVQLTIEDGGPNDADGLANGSIHDPGGVGRSASSNVDSSNADSSDLDTNSGSGKSGGGAIRYLLMLLFSLISCRWVASKCSVSSVSRRD
ncbi:choice-of-anchor U domain-containing protein [Litoribrevibacter albus]|uniref:PKD domain-containing protein n=1 Tax=Litoribrevibacter albus TaxID=1473156 RepID=A0AA37W774_9GAMM|nr:choice-of-anchor U domain-containing protein [Litoribrevibacter albus]GLQ32125.1 hypothetical protein GCM10007876_26040 [Litoribrevibacter albus]